MANRTVAKPNDFRFLRESIFPELKRVIEKFSVAEVAAARQMEEAGGVPC